MLKQSNNFRAQYEVENICDWPKWKLQQARLIRILEVAWSVVRPVAVVTIDDGCIYSLPINQVIYGGVGVSFEEWSKFIYENFKEPWLAIEDEGDYYGKKMQKEKEKWSMSDKQVGLIDEWNKSFFGKG